MFLFSSKNPLDIVPDIAVQFVKGHLSDSERLFIHSIWKFHAAPFAGIIGGYHYGHMTYAVNAVFPKDIINHVVVGSILVFQIE